MNSMIAPPRPLKLRACDEEDLKVVAGYLQDAIVPIGDMCFLPEEKRFVMVVNRFKWETAKRVEQEGAAPAGEGEGGGPCFERTHCGLCFDGIEHAATRGIDLHDRGQILNLLTLGGEDGSVIMHFSGGACIRLDGRDWHCRVEDLGEPWPTTCKPCHLFDEEASGR